MVQLAIKGHPTRGKEVIQLLEMLGGKNIHNYVGTSNECYAIDDNKICTIYTSVAKIDNCVIFTLEEFEKLYPYKVGDDVITKSNNVYKIKEMMWNNKEIVYALTNGECTICWYNTAELQPYKEEGVNLQELERKLDEALAKETTESLNKWLDEENMNTNNLCTRCVYAVDNHCGLRGFTNDFNRFYCSAQNADKLPNGFELQPDGYFSWVDSKPQYPKDYEESCKVLGISRHYVEIDLPHPYQQKMFNLFKLHICRDAYWKIAGKELGLGKPWKPDWSTEYENKYVIEVYRNNVRTNSQGYSNTILAFPTVEMRNAFYDNFKGLIEQCKELL